MVLPPWHIKQKVQAACSLAQVARVESGSCPACEQTSQLGAKDLWQAAQSTCVFAHHCRPNKWSLRATGNSVEHHWKTAGKPDTLPNSQQQKGFSTPISYIVRIVAKIDRHFSSRLPVAQVPRRIHSHMCAPQMCCRPQPWCLSHHRPGRLPPHQCVPTAPCLRLTPYFPSSLVIRSQSGCGGPACQYACQV